MAGLPRVAERCLAVALQRARLPLGVMLGGREIAHVLAYVTVNGADASFTIMG